MTSGTCAADPQRGIRGETISEALVSLLIATLVFSFLTNAVVTAARINAAIRNEDVSYELDGATASGSPVEVSVNGVSLGEDYQVQVYTTSAGQGEVSYRYYEYVAL